MWYIVALDYFWNDLLLHWLRTIFLSPFLNLDMLWILVPVWISWFFSEFFQEKTGTSMGNAITNATIVVWAAIDCTRQTIRLVSGGDILLGWDIFSRFILLALLFLYGMLVLVLGWKGNSLIKKIGRIREMTYVFVMFVPVFYNEFPLTFNHLISAIIFFPVFYYAIELLDHLTPNPKAIKMDSEDLTSASKSKADEGIASLVQQPAPAQPSQPVQPRQQPPPQQNQTSPLLMNRRKGGGFWDFKL